MCIDKNVLIQWYSCKGNYEEIPESDGDQLTLRRYEMPSRGVGNEAKLRRFHVVRELIASSGSLPDADTINAEVERRMALQVQQALEQSRGLPSPIVLRSLLTDEEIARIFAYIDSVDSVDAATNNPHESGEDEAELVPGSAEWVAEQMRLTAQLGQYSAESEACGDDGSVDDGGLCDDDEEEAPRWVQCSDEHEKLYIHREDGTRPSFPQACPSILEKLSSTAREHADACGMCATSAVLNYRCIEFHKYTVGGGLMDPGHTDAGSVITLSVQLSVPEPNAGGRFLTTDASGATTEWELGRGDAILFSSRTVHNITELTSGTRNSMVIEWWDSARNVHDRDS